jgi:eukaryotic-like serine/threonine-protein kinase
VPAKVILQVTRGPMEGKTFEYDSHNLFILGRRSHCQASIDDDYVSRHHFILEASPPAVRLMDLGSLHGTIVNDRKYGGKLAEDTTAEGNHSRPTSVDLKDGDRICVGKSELLVRIIAPPTCEDCGQELVAPIGGTLPVTGSVVQCDACRESKARELKADLSSPDKLPAKGCCVHCGMELFQTIEQPTSDEWSSSDFVCLHCQRSSPVGIKQLVHIARKVWKKFSAGNKWEGYEIESELGAGNMGQVYKARREADGRIVAIKTMLAKVAVSEKSRQMFLREIDVMRQLKHANLVSFIESRSTENQFFFVMEFCDGGSLETLMEKTGRPIPFNIALPMLVQCLDGLHSAHQAKIVHRDLKPGNILLTHTAGKTVAKIGDLGLAKSFDRAGYSGMTVTGTAGGTPAFMPREQLTDFKSAMPTNDIWSLAASFYNAMTGEIPLDFPTQRDQFFMKAIYMIILNNEPVPIRDRNPAIPAEIADVIDRALLVEPGRRFQSAAEMKMAILKNCSHYLAG